MTALLHGSIPKWDLQHTGFGLATRQWNFTTAAEQHGRRTNVHKLTLRHNQISGGRYVLLDGREVPGSRGSTSPLDECRIVFTVDGASVEVARLYYVMVLWAQKAKISTIIGPSCAWQECLMCLFSG